MVTEKIGKIKNELLLYRYDVIFKKNSNKKAKKQTRIRYFRADVKCQSSFNPKIKVSGKSLAYVIYTSGSTGKPKGVMIEHHSVINRIFWMQRKYKIGPNDTILQKTPYTFDVSVWELFLWLVKGSKLVLLPQGYEKDMLETINIIWNNDITTIHFVPSVFNIFLNYLATDRKYVAKIKSLKRIFFSGEVLYKNQIVRFKKISKSTYIGLHNLYGPTEATVDVTYFDCKNKVREEAIPIGLPIDNTFIYLLDENKKPVKMGEKGELYISGVGVARGYLNNNELTHERFMSDPFRPGNTMYFTGDIAKRMPDGNILYLDRIDNQIKIGGIRIELGEIAQNIIKTIGTDQCVVKLVGKNDKKVLVAYYTSKNKYDSADVKSRLSNVLPAYMIPGIFVHVEKMPLNASGKIDINKLPEPNRKNGNINNINSLPSVESIKILYKNVLKCTDINNDSNFFELGGSSLMAMELIYKINALFNIELPAKIFFENSRISEISKKVSELISYRNSGTRERIIKNREKDSYKLSDAQRRLWFLYKLDDKSVSYNVLQITKINGKIDITALEKSLQRVIDKQSILRAFFIEKNGEPFQKIRRRIKIKIDKLDLSKTISKKGNAVKREIYNFYNTPFVLEQDILLKAKLIKTSKNGYLFCLCLHHIVCDGWSMFILNREISESYGEIISGDNQKAQSLPIQYTDYSSWISGKKYRDRIKKQEQFWIDEFSNIPQAVELPIEKSKSTKDAINAINTDLSPDLSEKITLFCRENNATYFMFFLACFYLFLCRTCGTDDIAIGTPIANRPNDDLKNLIGFFSNTLAIRIKIDDSDNFLDLLTKVKNKLLNAFENQSYPFDELIKKINPERNSSINPIFNVLFTYFDKNRDLLSLKGAETDIYYNKSEKSKFDLTMSIIEGSNHFAIETKFGSQFQKKGVEDFIRRFSYLVENVLEGSYKKIYDIEILTALERIKLLDNCGKNVAVDPSLKLYDFIERNASLVPHKIALKYRGDSIDYSTFNCNINKFARFLRRSGVNRNVPVGILMDKSINLYISIYAVLKAGGAYVPIDPDLPIERINDILGESKLKHIILSDKFNGFLDGSRDNLEKIFPESKKDIINSESGENIKKVNESSDLAYIIYTSGSTGRPKGVMCSHIGVINTIITAADIFKIKSNSNILQFGNITFDTSVLDMNLAFYCGATLISASKDDMRDPALLRSIIIENNVNFGLFIPTTLYHLNIENTQIKCLASGSESITNHLVDKISKTTKFVNTYGPTEFSIFCTYWPAEKRRDNFIPIGKPVYNTTIYILDKFLKPVPMGVNGEIYLSGIGISHGYLNNKEQTERSFINNPYKPGTKMYKTGDIGKFLSDGNIVFVGRKDSQVKIRGFRVELGDIESNLIAHKKIKECVASIQKYNGEDCIIVHYISAEDIEESALRKFLRGKIPSYMLPTRFIRLLEIPHNINGKVDRKKLPLVTVNEIVHQNEKNIIDKIINVWKKVLGTNKISQDSNFFDLGGHSILVLKVLFYLKTLYKINLSPKDFYDKPTPRLISDLILAQENKNGDSLVIKETKTNLIEKPLNLQQIQYKNILVTGGTGFLGAYLINELLKRQCVQNVFVLVKSDNDKDAENDVANNLRNYFKEIDLSKIRVVRGDISEIGLSIEFSVKKEILESVELVIHAAADVSHVGDYNKFYRTNVLGTKNILDFIGSKKDIRFCHVSTLSIAGSYVPGIKKYIVKEDDLDFGQKFESFYDQSKFEAEKIVQERIKNGLNAVIFRFGNIVGATGDYTFQKNKKTNAFYNYLRSIIKTKCSWGIDANFNLSPVDICAKMLLHIAHTKDANGKTFHLFNWNLISNDVLVNFLNDFGLGLSKSEREFRDSDDEFIPFLNNYMQGADITKYVYDNQNTKLFTKTIADEWPKIDRSIIEKIVNQID